MSKRNARLNNYLPNAVKTFLKGSSLSTANEKPNKKSSQEDTIGDQLHSSQDIVGEDQFQKELYWKGNKTFDEDIVETIMNSEDNVETIQRISLKDSNSRIVLVAPKFKIILMVDSVLNYNSDPSNVLEKDDKVPFVEGSLYSKGEVVRDWNSICNKHLLTAKAELDILNWLYNVAGHKLNLPVSLNKEGHKRLQKQIVGLAQCLPQTGNALFDLCHIRRSKTQTNR
jgi:hypothetical protein